MKKTFLFILLGVVSLILLTVCACSTTTYKETSFDRDGKVLAVREVGIKRPIFASTAVSWAGLTGNINSASSVDLNQMVGAMLAGYLASQVPAVGPVVTEGAK